MAHNLLNSKTLEEKMVIEKPIVTALPVVVQTRETGCQTDFKVSLIDQEQPITSHFPETLTGMRLKQMAEALQELASEKA
jgi:hypothetical protein